MTGLNKIKKNKENKTTPGRYSHSYNQRNFITHY